MNLAPNPASDNLRVTMTEEVDGGQAIVHDAQGNVVIQAQVQGGSFVIDVAGLSIGPYYLSYMRGGERIVSGFSVQR